MSKQSFAVTPLTLVRIEIFDDDPKQDLLAKLLKFCIEKRIIAIYHIEKLFGCQQVDFTEEDSKLILQWFQEQGIAQNSPQLATYWKKIDCGDFY